MDTRPPLRWISAALSHVGGVRKLNEDACLIREVDALWTVADGMGGHLCGDVASQAIVQALAAVPRLVSLSQGEAEITASLKKVNAELRQLARQQGPGQVIGSTAVVLTLIGARYLIGWVGDSRAYRLRAGELSQITRDHTHVAELVERGYLRADEADSHPMSNVLTRAVGAQDELEVDFIAGDVVPGDMFLLCSDGLTKELTHAEITQILSQANPHDGVRALIHSTLLKGARDSVTAVAVQLI